MPALLQLLLTTLGPVILQNAPALIEKLIPILFPTLASKASMVAAAASGTSAVLMANGKPEEVSTPSDPVTFVQELLVGLGHSVTIDGELGPETIGALETALGLLPGGPASTAITDILTKVEPTQN